MTRKERIAVIKECEKTIYDKRRYLTKIKHNIRQSGNFDQGLALGEAVLFDKRKRLKAKLKK